MAKTVASPHALTGERMTPPSITLLPDKRSSTNGHGSPGRTGKTTPSSTEKKPYINGHASPSHLAAHHAAVEGYMKTDDRMRLAKERREEREKSLVAREQLIREKERRARLQYERTVEERWRRLDEQRQREEHRRAAVEEKRRQQLEEDRERLEALMKRSLERSLLLEQRPKRWGRGCHAGAGDSENAPLPFSAASAFSHGIASPLPAVSESAPCSPHRSPFCSSPNPADHSRAGLQGGSQSTPNTPKRERLRRERRTASPGYGSPVRRSESPAGIPRHLASPTASKLASKVRAQSPNNAHQHHHSPARHRPNASGEDRRAENARAGKHGEPPKADTSVKNSMNMNSASPPPPRAGENVVDAESTKIRSPEGDASGNHQSPGGKDCPSPKVDSSGGRTQSNGREEERKKESAPCSGKAAAAAAGTTNAEEATRLLAERRRQARAQKELEEKKQVQQQQQQEEEQRRKEARLREQLAQEREAKAQQAKETEKGEEDRRGRKQKEEKRTTEEQENEPRGRAGQEKENAKVQAQDDAERQRQDRELQKQQEEDERQLRKKRIEEIMKRTRKCEADLKKEAETRSVSPPGDIKAVQTDVQGNEQASKKVEFQVDESVAVQVNGKECGPVTKKEAAVAQMESPKSAPGKNHTHRGTPTHSVPEKRPDTKPAGGEHLGQLADESQACALAPPGRTDVNAKQRRENVAEADQANKGPTKTRADAGAGPKQGATMNGAVKGKGSALTSSRLAAEGSKQHSLRVSAVMGDARGGSQVEVVKPTVSQLPVAHLSPPIIRLEPLDVKGTGSCDEVQPMEVSPASKEELISIPEFSPLNETQYGGLSDTRALEDLMDLTGSVAYPQLSSQGNTGDCNKNLIEGVVSPVSDSKLVGMPPSPSNKCSVK